MIARRHFGFGIAIAAMLFAAHPGRTDDSTKDRVPRPLPATVLEENAADLLKVLTNPTGDPGEGHVEEADRFSGKSCIRIVPLQRFSNLIPGWKHRIAEHPKDDEFRFLRFAWKSDGGTGIMVQLHNEKDWIIRYTAGVDAYGWGTKYVADKPPAEWNVVTVDLFKDYGANTIQGIALTSFGARAAYFDHIYFARSIEDLDRLDATGFRDKPLDALSAGDLDRLWGDLMQRDASMGYRAFWRLVAEPKTAAPFLKDKLLSVGGPAGKQIKAWIAQLDDDDYAVREQASLRLTENFGAAEELLTKTLATTSSAEVRTRIKTLLAKRIKVEAADARLGQAIRALEYMDAPAATAVLTDLAKADAGANLNDLARQAVERINRRAKE